MVIVVAQATGSESIDDYRGLARRPPLSAISFAVFLFSLTGLPPFAGSTGKWYLFVAVLQNYSLPGGGWYAALAVIGAWTGPIELLPTEEGPSAAGFGHRVAASGSTVLVGASGAKEFTAALGAAYVFDLDI